MEAAIHDDVDAEQDPETVHPDHNQSLGQQESIIDEAAEASDVQE